MRFFAAYPRGRSAIAIAVDSQILVIAAMVLGPEFGAVAALGVALVRRRPALLWLASRTLFGGFAIAIVITTVAMLAAKRLGWVAREDVTGPRPGTEFIYFPDKWSFIVAVIAVSRPGRVGSASRSGPRPQGQGLAGSVRRGHRVALPPLPLRSEYGPVRLAVGPAPFQEEES